MIATGDCQTTLLEWNYINEKKNSTTDGNRREIKYDGKDIHSAHFCRAGGECQDPKILSEIEDIDFSKRIDPIEGRKVQNYYEELNTNFSRFNCPITLDPATATFDDVALHALFRQRLSVSTVEKRMRYARFMESYSPFPVDFRNPSFENFIRHMDYREQIDFAVNIGTSALSHEWKTMKMFLKAYGIPLWSYKPPSSPASKTKYIPRPETVYEMIHYTYNNDPYENALIQYTILHSFMIGWRNPSELCELTLKDVDFEEKTLTITEPKKHRSTRILVPDYSMLDGKNRKSFKYWVDYWRPKVENYHSKDAVYLRPDGHPIQPDQYRMFIGRNVKPVFPRFNLYSTRHFCAIGRLIKVKLETGNYETLTVRNWLGHNNIQTTMTYIRDAEQYMKRNPFDWFQRVLKFQKNKKMGEDNALKISTRPKKRVLTENPSRSVSGPEEI